jgi:hypothetical protein
MVDFPSDPGTPMEVANITSGAEEGRALLLA